MIQRTREQRAHIAGDHSSEAEETIGLTPYRWMARGDLGCVPGFAPLIVHRDLFRSRRPNFIHTVTLGGTV